MTDPIAKILGEWSQTMGLGGIALRIILSFCLSAIIGCERSSKRHSAGLRTFILISLAMTVSAMIDGYLVSAETTDIYVISGAALLGVAIISVRSLLINSRSQIKGLTTAAALWACAVIGLAAGAGYYTVTLISFAVILCSLSILPALERYLKDRSNYFEIQLELKDSACLSDFVAIIRRLGLKIDDIEANPAYTNSGISAYSVSITVNSAELKKYKTHTEIIEALRSLEYVTHIEEL